MNQTQETADLGDQIRRNSKAGVPISGCESPRGEVLGQNPAISLYFAASCSTLPLPVPTSPA